MHLSGTPTPGWEIRVKALETPDSGTKISTSGMKVKKISVRRAGDIRLTTAAVCGDNAYWVQV